MRRDLSYVHRRVCQAIADGHGLAHTIAGHIDEPIDTVKISLESLRKSKVIAIAHRKNKFGAAMYRLAMPLPMALDLFAKHAPMSADALTQAWPLPIERREAIEA